MADRLSYLVALEGFGDFEHDALVFCFRQAEVREPSYRFTANLTEADMVVADGDSAEAVATVVCEARTSQVVFVGRSAPPGALMRVARPIDPVRILRCLDELVAAHRDEGAPRAVDPAPAQRPPAHAVPTLPLLSEVRGGGLPAPGAEARATAKAKARQAARRARQASDPDAHGMAPALTDVLVFDRDSVAREQMAIVIERFGFTAHATGDTVHAAELLQARPFVAVFLAVVLDGSDNGAGVVLCRLARDPDATPAQWTRALLVVGAHPQPTDPVRAKLAGADQYLAKPVSRGDVARALEASGVALPLDARR